MHLDPKEKEDEIEFGGVSEGHYVALLHSPYQIQKQPSPMKVILSIMQMKKTLVCGRKLTMR